MDRKIPLLLAGGFALAVSGCYTHVNLAAPPPSAPAPERIDAYNHLKPLSYHQTEVFQSGMTTRYTDYLQLANGSRVYYPEDLYPVIPPDSPTAHAVDASVSKRETASGLQLGAIGAFIGGMALAFVPLLASHGDTTGTVLPGLGLALFGGVGLGIAAKVVRSSAEDEAATAYETYDDSLQKRLSVCARGEQVAECKR